MKKILKLLTVMLVASVAFVVNDISIQAIDTGREDLGILDSLKISDSYGNELTDGSSIHNGETYILKYSFSLDEPTSDYKNKVAKFDIPDIFKSESLNPDPMKLMYNDGTSSYEIGTVEADLSSGKITVTFNDHTVLGTKSNITGWISLTATAESTTGSHEVVVLWDGSNETSFNFNVTNDGIGDNDIARLNKFVTSGLEGTGQPTVLQKADGTYYISFAIEVFISQDYADLTIKDNVYAGLKIDEASIKVISRPRDGTQYYSPTNTEYKANYDQWAIDNPTGELAVRSDITSSLIDNGSIMFSADGFEINMKDVSFDSPLASRQMTTTPLQMKYLITYDTILTNVDTSLSLEEIQEQFESQTVRNDVQLISTEEVIKSGSWVKASLGAGAIGETRDVVLYKVDSETNESLDGAIFNLYKQNTYDETLWELYAADVTVINGNATVQGLVFGTYRFEELVAPEGYLLPAEPFESFIVDSTTPTSEFEIILENSKEPTEPIEPTDPTDPVEPTEPVEPTKPVLPKTGMKTNLVFAYLTLGLILVKNVIKYK